MWALFRWGLNAKLEGLKTQLETQLDAILEKVGKVDEHEVDIREIKTVMRMNGCADGNPMCDRRRREV